METKPLLFGIIGFILGGFVVSLAATTIYAPQSTNHDSMANMTHSLQDKTGDEFDAAYISSMIAHHQAAVDMANLADSRAKHSEIKSLSRAIINAQNSEIDKMKVWQNQWGYTSTNTDHTSH